jgi:hypothetical protein
MDKHLTLHLYRVQEVLASLRNALIKHNYRETLFWGLELYDSDVISESLEMLFGLWMDVYGIPSWQYLIELHKIQEKGELERDTWVHLLMAWSQQKNQDSTLFQLLVRGLRKDTNWLTSFPHTLTYTNEKDAITDCLTRGKLLEAWLFARSLSAEDQWQLLESVVSTQDQSKVNAISVLSGLSYGDPIQKRAAAFCVVALDSKRWALTQVPIGYNSFALQLETVRLMDDWNEYTILRKQRIFAIRPEAINHVTERSSISTQVSTESDIQENLETTLWNSPYWRGVMSAYVLELDENQFVWASTSDKEEFYDTYFQYPGDIPDEWSIADREKSHGRGLGKTEVQSRRQYICSGVLRNTKTLPFWEPLVFKEEEDIVLDLSAYTSEDYNIQFPLKPVRKEFDITLTTIQTQSDIEFVKHQSVPLQDAHMSSHTDEEED